MRQKVLNQRPNPLCLIRGNSGDHLYRLAVYVTPTSGFKAWSDAFTAYNSIPDKYAHGYGKNISLPSWLRYWGSQSGRMAYSTLELFVLFIGGAYAAIVLLMLGMQLKKTNWRTSMRRELWISIVMRIVGVPALSFVTIQLLGLHGLEASVLFVQSSMPSAICQFQQLWFTVIISSCQEAALAEAWDQ